MKNTPNKLFTLQIKELYLNNLIFSIFDIAFINAYILILTPLVHMQIFVEATALHCLLHPYICSLEKMQYLFPMVNSLKRIQFLVLLRTKITFTWESWDVSQKFHIVSNMAHMGLKHTPRNMCFIPWSNLCRRLENTCPTLGQRGHVWGGSPPTLAFPAFVRLNFNVMHNPDENLSVCPNSRLRGDLTGLSGLISLCVSPGHMMKNLRQCPTSWQQTVTHTESFSISENVQLFPRIEDIKAKCEECRSFNLCGKFKIKLFYYIRKKKIFSRFREWYIKLIYFVNYKNDSSFLNYSISE